MRFRRKELLFLECQIIHSICLVASIGLMIFDRQLVSILLMPSVSMLAAFILYLVLDQEYIIMNEEGITCLKGKKLHWCYKWSEIDELKIGNRFRNPSVEIVLKNNCYKDSGGIETSETYFQLGFAAKKAMKNYYKTGDGLHEPYQGDGDRRTPN